MRRDNYRAKNLVLCGNFNLTNVNDIFNQITAQGQFPRQHADTFILLEQLGHRLDREVERLYQQEEKNGKTGLDLTYAYRRPSGHDESIERMCTLMGRWLRNLRHEWQWQYVFHA